MGEGMPVERQAELVERLQSDRGLGDFPLTERERALVAYADKLTLTPAAIRREDIDRLRLAGFDDRAIHDACAIVAYFAFVNRIADGLGVELERPSGLSSP